jgi:LCP family protein required for cell wall assembly
MLVLILLVAVGGGTFGYKIIAASDSISDTERSILGQLKDLLFNSGSALAGEKEGRINILLLAVGGAGHQGEDLADTIMLASIEPSTNKAALLSIPRDLYVQVPDEQYFSKINAVHAYGESQESGEGPRLLKEVVEDITGQAVHYYVRVDFTAFKGIVDAVGGVNIQNETSFFDYWHKISFPAGTEKMNGERALAYVRARYIEGSEGGDFKRAARQQQVLLALREKVFSVQTAFDPTRVSAILDSLSENIRTDMELWEMRRLYELARLTEPSKVHSVVLTSGPTGVLTGGTEVLGGVPASVLRPRTGDYSEIQTLARNIFSATPETIPTSAPAETPEPTPTATPTPTPLEKPSLEIRNGTTITGLAGRMRTRLEEDGYTVTGVSNAVAKDNANTVVYTLTDEHGQAASELAEEMEAELQRELPTDEPTSEAEVLIILGADANEE